MEGPERYKTVRISVRELVEFVMRSGDLDDRRTAAAQRDAMQEGSRLHRKIQKRMGAEYRAEVPMKHVVGEGEFEIAIEGRADGVITEEAGFTIDEIKGVYLDLSGLEEPVPVHLAQAMCYGYIYSFDHGLNRISLQLTYCSIETEEIRRFRFDKDWEELETWFQGLIHEYVKWARYLYLNGIRRDASIRELKFPYPYREGQKELAVDVYRALIRQRNLFIQAPTGIGKTLSTVYPALKAMGKGYGEKLFYLTAKTITRSVAEEGLELLREHGLQFKSVTITAKEKLCFLESPECNPDACPYAKGHFDRVNDAVFDIIYQEGGITRETVLRYAETHRVCPFEFCLDISSWMDGIICDYNYVFDPKVRLKRFFAEGGSAEYLFLVDEAHNLVARGREMFSAGLVKEDFLLVKRLIKSMSRRLCGQLERCNRELLELKRECGDYRVLPEVNHLAVSLMSLLGELETFLEERQAFEDRDLVLDFYFVVRDFLNIHDRLGDDYRIYVRLQEDGRFLLKLFCVNPARNLKECLDRAVGTIFFSATLLPVSYYKELLSGNPEDYAVYAHSPFSDQNRLLLVAGDVSSRYTRRNRREYEKVLNYIRRVAGEQKGNYIAFFPSYRYMRQVEALMEETEGLEREFTWLTQSSGMSEAERERFLEEFQEEREDTMVALCVMGGIFSEGIDLKEKRLIGAFIVGTGLPMVCAEQEILKDYFDGLGKRGFDFAYQYPGMNKVMQAAGRVIRTAGDQGIIALLDERFLHRDYQALFPREWQSFRVVSLNNVGDAVRGFWKEQGG